MTPRAASETEKDVKPIKLFARDALDAPAEPQGNFRIVGEIEGLRPRDIQSLNSDDVYDAFKMLRWGWTDGRPVHSCGSDHVYEYASRNIFKCARCGEQFSLTSKTLFHARKLPHKDILAALSFALHDPMNAHALSQEMNLNYRTTSRLIKTFRVFAGNIQVSKASSRWPYLTRVPTTEYETMMIRVANEMPRNLPEQVRADVGQEIVLGLISEQFDIQALQQQIKKYVRLHNLCVESNPWRDTSLNHPVPGTDGMMWDDTLALNEEGRISRQSDWLRMVDKSEPFRIIFDGEVLREQERLHSIDKLWSREETAEFLNED